ncbi:MAG: carbon-nitrogen hydrolase family protein [Pseudoclavibacter sp.]
MHSSPFNVGLAQRVPLAIDAPLEQFADDIASTMGKHPGIDLLVYPEMHLHGTEHLPEAERPAALEAAAVALDSSEVRAIGAIAKQHGIWLVPGSIGERGPRGEFFNTQLLFAPDGGMRARYRKMFPWRPFEPHVPGTEFVVAPIRPDAPIPAAGTVADATSADHADAHPAALTAGLSICYDAWFPEHSRQLAWLGADVVLNIVKTTTPDREQELVLARANAIANQNYVLSVNCADPVGRGRSIAVDPEGFVVGEASLGETTLVVPVDPERVAQVRRDGTAGSNRVWSQFAPGDASIPLPMYDGRIDPATWAPRGPRNGTPSRG